MLLQSLHHQFAHFASAMGAEWHGGSSEKRAVYLATAAHHAKTHHVEDVVLGSNLHAQGHWVSQNSKIGCDADSRQARLPIVGVELPQHQACHLHDSRREFAVLVSMPHLCGSQPHAVKHPLVSVKGLPFHCCSDRSSDDVLHGSPPVRLARPAAATTHPPITEGVRITVTGSRRVVSIKAVLQLLHAALPRPSDR